MKRLNKIRVFASVGLLMFLLCFGTVGFLFVIRMKNSYENGDFAYGVFNNKVYYEEKFYGFAPSSKFHHLEQIDASEARVISKYYIADNDSAYYKNILIDQAKGKTFNSYDWIEDTSYHFAYDKSNIYLEHRAYKDSASSTLKPANVDSRYYFASEENVYYVDDLREIENSFEKILEKLPNSDPNTWGAVKYYKKKINSERKYDTAIEKHSFTKDKDNVYYTYKKLPDADPQNFILLDNPLYLGENYGTDKDNIYYHNLKLKQVDKSSFEVIDTTYAKDDERVFYKADVIEGMKPDKLKRFKCFSYKGFPIYTDGNIYYSNGEYIAKEDGYYREVDC
jgi:hypothetical protein